MPITEALILPEGVILTPVEELPQKLKEQFSFEQGDYTITRLGARTPSKIIDSQSVELINEFKTPCTVVNAVVNFSRRKSLDPDQVLEGAFPFIKGLMNSSFLVLADSNAVEQITPMFKTGDMIGNYEVVKCIQVLEDTELYQVEYRDDQMAALKILRPNCKPYVVHELEHEVAVLKHLEGCNISPALLDVGTFEDRKYILIEWCKGSPVSVASSNLRQLNDGNQELLKLCNRIVRSYALLHEKNVIHSDVHPRNIMCDENMNVKIIDYGLARVRGTKAYGEPRRGGVGYYFEPEYAKVHIQNQRSLKASVHGEQYSVAAILYEIITGFHYVDFSIERDEMWKQIAENDPLPFSARGIKSWPEMEAVLAKALRKEPSERYSSMEEFATAIEGITVLENEEPPEELTVAPAMKSDKCTLFLDHVLKRIGLDGSLYKSGIITEPSCSLTYGSAGIAYTLYKIACIRNDPSLLSLANIWLSKAYRGSLAENAFYTPNFDLIEDTLGRVSPYHTINGLHCVQALIGHAMGDVVAMNTAIAEFTAVSMLPCDNLDLTLGKSSTLLACSILLDVLKDTQFVDTTPIRMLGDQIINTIWGTLEKYAPIGKCHEVTYLGIAHGWAGLIYSALRWHKSSGSPLPSTLEERLEQLTRIAEPVGKGVRWKVVTHMPRSSKTVNYMSGWCNGSAGYIWLMTLAHEIFKKELYLELARKVALNTWENDEVASSICCGFAGRSYGLLNLYNYTGEKQCLNMATELANKAVTITMMDNVYKDSLYKGDMGVAALIADLENPATACMPWFGEEK